jgi:hypothetical protein
MFGSSKDSQGFVNDLGMQGIFELRVTKPDGTIRKQFAEFNWAREFRKAGIALPNISYITGTKRDEVVVRNLVTNAGFAGAAARLGDDATEAKFNYLAVGIGTTAANAADTTLESEIVDSGLARATATVSRVTTTQTDDTHQLVKSWSVSGTKAVTEIGMLNAGAGGVLLGRNVFSAVNVLSGDSFQATYKIKCA